MTKFDLVLMLVIVALTAWAVCLTSRLVRVNSDDMPELDAEVRWIQKYDRTLSD